MTREDLQDAYKTNKDFREYVDKYCAKHRLTDDKALEHNIIKAIALMYETKAQKRTEGGRI